jgi:hypothetical protein
MTAPATEPETESSSVEDLRAAARAAIAEADKGETTQTEESESQAFTSGALGLQALNPEISISGDVLGSYVPDASERPESDFLFRSLGLHLESYLDPYSRFKAALPFNDEGAELEEAYFTRFGVVPDVNVTLGKFRQQFGVVNRWHKHGLDQVDHPTALRMIFGDEGLNQTGASAEWTMPDLAGFSQETVLQVTDGSNDRVFGQNEENIPSGLLHYRLYRDLSPATYAELGGTALYGQNNEWQVGEEFVDKTRGTWVFGADFSVVWEPTDQMRYRNLVWRSEAYALNKDIVAPDGSGGDDIESWGIYSYLESQVSRTLVLGLRWDYFEPDAKEYAAMEGVDLAPLVFADDNAYLWQLSPYITWYQSPFVHFRFQYERTEGDSMPMDEDVFWLQCIFAAGPHKHERY